MRTNLIHAVSELLSSPDMSLLSTSAGLMNGTSPTRLVIFTLVSLPYTLVSDACLGLDATCRLGLSSSVGSFPSCECRRNILFSSCPDKLLQIVELISLAWVFGNRTSGTNVLLH